MVCVTGMSSGAGLPCAAGDDAGEEAFGEVPDMGSVGLELGEPGGRAPLPFGTTLPSGFVMVIAGVPWPAGAASCPLVCAVGSVAPVARERLPWGVSLASPDWASGVTASLLTSLSFSLSLPFFFDFFDDCCWPIGRAWDAELGDPGWGDCDLVLESREVSTERSVGASLTEMGVGWEKRGMLSS